MVYLGEDKVRELVEEAVQTARNTTPGNVCDEAVVQWTMEDKFIDGRWRSTYFLDTGISSSNDERTEMTNGAA